MAYIPPKDVTAPHDKWTLDRVLLDDGEWTPAYALGTWEGVRCIATRWNGDEKKKAGFPLTSTNACWLILDQRLFDAVIDILPSYSDKTYARRFLEQREA